MPSTDIFATKGLEYLLVIAYLALLAGVFRFLATPRRPSPPRAADGHGEWTAIPDGFAFHPGHAWVLPEGADVVRVGVDEFALRLVGRATAVALPAVGDRLRQGEPGWTMEVESKKIPVLAPVDGRVVEVNHEVRESPGLLSDQPYHGGWLLKVRVRNARAAVKSLLSGRLARAWIDEKIERLRRMQAGGLGVVMPDGGVPVHGFARALAPEHWDDVARELLLTGDGEGRGA